MKKLGIILLTVVSALVIESKESFATHTAGMDIFYRHTQDSSYEFTLIFYRNCQGFTASAPGTVQIRAFSPSLGSTFNSGYGTINAPALPLFGPGVPPLEPANLYNCTGASSSLCYEEYVYRGTWTSTGRANDWTFGYQLCCRPNTNAPTNMQNGTQYIEAGLNNLDFPDYKAKNWSPLWHNRRPNHPGYTTDTIINYLFRTLCYGNYYSMDMSCREYQGDSVSYGFYWPQTNNGNPNGYINGWSFADPLPVLNTGGVITINPITGIIPIVPGLPTGTGIYVLGVEAIEWRYDTIVSGGAFAIVAKQIGYIRRDMTIWIDDTTTCRRDSVHPKDITITNGGGDTTVNVFFHTGIPGDPNSQVRCETLSPDGSEFRVLDSSNYVAPFDSTVRSIGVHRAIWNCNAGLTDKVILHLAEPLRCQEYTIMLKTGTDLDVLESECGFLEPEWSTGVITVTKDVQVNIDTNRYLTYCLPNDDPFPKLTASSNDVSSFPLSYYWAYRPPGGTTFDTIIGQEVPYVFGENAGSYKVLVRDPLNCTGDDFITIYHDTYPEFKFELDPYCDRFGEAKRLPDVIWAPDDSSIIEWNWFVDGLGLVHTGDTLREPQLIENEWYTLQGKKGKIDPRADKVCEYEYRFNFSRDSFPPQDELWVKFLDKNFQICISDTIDTNNRLTVWEEGIRDTHGPFDVQWYYYLDPVPGEQLSRKVLDTGIYGIHVEDTLGCWGRDTAWVTHDERLDGPEIPCLVQGNVGTFEYIWPPNYPIESNEVSLTGEEPWYPTSNGNTHDVQNIQSVKGIYGRGTVLTACMYTESSYSNECPDKVFPPNVITPNGDGLNDFFDIRGLELFVDSEVEIYDRWGNVVFQSSSYKNDWNGGDQPEGTYYYVLRVDDPAGTIHKGVITIIR